MARSLNKLTALTVKNIAPGKYSDGGGLWLHKRENGAGQWVFRFTIYSRRREMGLGSLVEVSLKDAREGAEKWRAVAAKGLDPIKERERERREAEKRLHLLSDVADDCFESKKAELKGDGAAGRWWSPVKNHVLPTLGKTPVAEIDQTVIRDLLSPIWHAKGETAKKVLNRLGIIMRHAAALGLEVDLQAIDKARALLGQQRHTPQNIPAMAWQDVPTFYATLSQGTVTQNALRLLILTGVRSGPLRYMHESQIEGDVWIIPGEAMKGRKGKTPEFRIPLVPEALAVIDAARPLARKGYLFPSAIKGVISDSTMAVFMKDKHLTARPHGFRSSLRDWIAETTETPHDVAEMMLAHAVGGKVERAYKRTDFLEQRRKLLERWANHVTGKGGKLLRLIENG